MCDPIFMHIFAYLIVNWFREFLPVPGRWSRLLYVHIDINCCEYATQIQNSNQKETIIATCCNNNIDDLTEPP